MPEPLSAAVTHQPIYRIVTTVSTSGAGDAPPLVWLVVRPPWSDPVPQLRVIAEDELRL